MNAAGVAPLQAAAAWKDFDFLSESLSMESPLRPNVSIRGNSQESIGNPGGRTVGGDIVCVPNTAFHYLFLANLQEHSDAGSASGSAIEHLLAPSESANDFDGLAIDMDRDDGRPQLYSDCYVNSWQVTVAFNEWVNSTFGIMGRRLDYWDDPDQDTGTPVTTSLRLRGLPIYSQLNHATNTELAFQVDAADTTILKAVYAAGTPSFAGATTFTIVVDTWTEVILTDGSRAGTIDQPVEIYVPSAALSINDVFSFDMVRGTWTPNYASAPKSLDNIYATIKIDGTEYCIENFQHTITSPIQAPPCIGALFPETIRRRGIRTAEGSVTRDYVDTNLQKRLERQEPFTLTVTMKNGELISGGGANEQYEVRLFDSLCVFTGPTKVIGGPDDGAEALGFRAFENPDEGSGYTDMSNVFLWTDDADLTD